MTNRSNGSSNRQSAEQAGASRQGKPVGTEIAFEFVLSDGSKVLRGTGAVAHIAEAPEPGVTIRFSALDESSRVFRILSK